LGGRDMSQDFYTLDGEKIKDIIGIYDYKRYTPSRIARDLDDYYEPNSYKVITAYEIQHPSTNYIEFFSTPHNLIGREPHKVKLVIEM